MLYATHCSCYEAGGQNGQQQETKIHVFIWHMTLVMVTTIIIGVATKIAKIAGFKMVRRKERKTKGRLRPSVERSCSKFVQSTLFLATRVSNRRVVVISWLTIMPFLAYQSCKR
jgi:hypothetical protein